MIRKNRLTASKFAMVLKACARKRYPPSLFADLSETYDLTSVRAIQWGRENEETAIKCFEEASNLKVSRTGLWLDDCGYLGASPDGLTVVNKKHDYWHQIQGQMHITNRNLCYLIVWTPKECEIIYIEKDPTWVENISILKEFF